MEAPPAFGEFLHSPSWWCSFFCVKGAGLMQSFLFKNHILFYTTVVSLLILMGVYISQKTPIHTEEYILTEFEKRVNTESPETPYTLVIRWRFPEGSKLYNPNETRKYTIDHSLWNGTKWILKKDNWGISPDKKSGILVAQYSTAEELNESYQLLSENRGMWKTAIKKANN